ncbi:MAG: rhodanese-like domain-containing protein [Acidimicrobiia bacterium]|nr:rhodanese-like domain-containing protein [Acidimicrobiia bacterium]
MKTASNSHRTSIRFVVRGVLTFRVALTLMIVIGVAVSGCGGPDVEPGASAENAIRLLPVEDFEAFVEDTPESALINVHIPYEGHIASTDEFVAFDRILDWEGLPEDRSEVIVLYCRSGSMSGQAARDLAEAGYTNIVDLEGGMNAWAASGRTLESDPPPGSG